MKSLQFTQLAKLNFESADKTIVRQGGFRLASGLHKLLQKVVFYLANSPGSVYGQPLVGSAAVAKLKTATLSDVTRADQLVASLQADLERWLKLSPTNLPTDEQLGSIALSVEAIGEESITIAVSITSAAGTAADYSYNLLTTV